MPVSKSPQTLGATRLYEPYRYAPGQKGLPDLSSVGTRHAWMGSTKSAFIANGYLALPGTSGNVPTVPSSSALNVSGDLDIRVSCAMDDWTPAAETGILSKAGTAGQFCWSLNIQTNGRPILYWSEDGTALKTASATVAPTVTDGSTIGVRATLLRNNGSAGRTITFYTSSDFSTWNILGSAVVQATGVTSIFAGTSSLSIGSDSGSARMPGRMYRAQIYNGIAGTLAFDADFSTQPVGTSTFAGLSANVATVTVNSSAADTNDPVLALSGTNLLQRNEALDDSAWTKTRCSVVPTTAAPSVRTASNQYAFKIVEDSTASNTHLAGVNASTLTVGQAYTWSGYFKAGERTTVYLDLSSGPFGTTPGCSFDLSGGTIVSSASCTPVITSIGSGWYRCAITATATVAASVTCRAYLVSGIDATYSGDGTSGLYAWGAQFEASPGASTYAPSASASLDYATDDYAFAPDATDLAFGAAFTLFGVVKIAAPGATMAIADQYDTNAARAWSAFATTAGKLRVILSADGGTTNAKDYTGSQAFADGTWRSFAVSYSGGAVSLYVNGVSDASPTKTTDGTVASLFDSTANLTMSASLASGVAANNLTGSVAALALLPTGLSSGDVTALHNYYSGQLSSKGVGLPSVGGSVSPAVMMMMLMQ